MDEYEVTPGVLNIAETCAASVSINDLLALSEDPNIPHPIDLSKKLTYGSIRGSDALRDRLASLYSVRSSSPLPKDNILITQGAINANFLILYTLVGPGDHVVCMHPTYQQLYDVPKSLGAEVSLWKLRREKKYIPDIDDLKTLVKGNTKLIIINNPNNPTGATTPKSILQELVAFVKEKDIIILSDEVYRPLFHGIGPMEAEFPPSILSLGYAKTISTGSMSKAYSLAGIRCGWIASRDRSIIEAVSTARDYTTISVSQLDDSIASFALSNSVIHALLGRNIALAKTNFALLEAFINEHSHICSWIKPTGGTTALVRFEKKGVPVDDVQFCKEMVAETKVMMVPASKCFGEEFRGEVRIGFVNETEVLRKALEVLGPFIRRTLG
jgi:aspartate/methionine/tyrosine aminotransferase